MAAVNNSEMDGLRQRNLPVQTSSEAQARHTVLQLNALEEETGKHEKDKKTFGRTPEGQVFTVPETHDMVSQLLSPTEPKNVSDLVVLAILALHIFLLWVLPPSVRVPFFAIVFTFWRACCNVGIGWLLQKQSHQQTMVRWARKSNLFGEPTKCTRPRLRAFIKRELETKIREDYNFDTAPLEYNAWLVFRRVVDLILMCDFTSYVAFAITCGHRPEGETNIVTVGRWVVGLFLFAFNLWVKLDAHRVVKDFAWYWGDFFYLIDQELTFDGVFEMAPHPMYSIGYVGYYGISLMAASYKVLFVSILAHAAQFAFLVWVENPHIERTYNSPPPRRRTVDSPKRAENQPIATGQESVDPWPKSSYDQPPATHNLLGIQNLDLYRVTDTSVIILQFFLFALTVLTPNNTSHQALFVVNAAIWRLWYSVGIGYLLNRQSTKKKWTRHFVKYGESIGEAWRQWKGTYHLSMVLCYASFVAAAWKMYTPPENWEYGLAILKHTIGLGLVALQIWVSFSIYDQLGEFGWFFGDFFFDHHPKLTYGGIYRFLNNPERVLGLAGVWGVALITNSKAMFALALLSHTVSLLFIQFVERPHMQKLYGRSLRQDAGLVRSLRRSLPPPLRQWQDGMDKMLSEAFDTVEEFLDAAKPKLEARIENVLRDTRDLIKKYPARMAVTRVHSDITALDVSDYALEIEGTPASTLVDVQRSSDKEAFEARSPPERTTDYKALTFEYGAPIKVKWTAPRDHSKKDWIGLYMVADNASREVTRISSSGRWTATNPGEYDSSGSEIGLVSSDDTDEEETDLLTGSMLFAGDKLWWTQGVFEFRYHHDGKHNVMAVSLPFEIRIPRFTEDDLDLLQLSTSPAAAAQDPLIRRSVADTLLPLVQNCFDRDPEIAPSSVHEAFGSLVDRDGKYARRVVYAVHQMFGIEFASEVVKADGKVENLAWRIWEAKKVLAPYSMSHSKGTSTPQ